MVGLLECRLAPALDTDISLDNRSKFNAWGNVVDVRLEMLWDVVSINQISRIFNTKRAIPY